jgi:hypothetical protein
VYNNLALAMSKQLKMSGKECSAEASWVINTYQRGLKLLEQSKIAGCDVQQDLNSIRLNFGLFLSNQDSFEQAARVLEPIARTRTEGSTNGRLVEDAYRLWKFCDKKMR